ncbi:sucrose-6-phosphate hydrolase [Halobacillus amylolyticus]|uniref:Sucrose-6-phosphate hydrolase n=1 Tax=Halobacillus amylolyticus TaxID=2932259 RepID=A0ABY4HAQ1_9BACI|nr:sucrose-6-phosphate hydrolase [Halobacillus amylolyticus]UOR11503.1 sucrose-6-phosphate hydrolase [Halobacillus amylolyticus]
MSNDQSLREQAYQAIEKYEGVVRQDPYRQCFHLSPPVGLLNDPNGWIQWKGIYHLYFQWMPFHTGHGAKFWGHYSSRDLVNWTLEPIALTPSEWYDKNGCYSGSAITDQGKLKVFYTGNVKDENGNRETYQCSAESDNGVDFVKNGVEIYLPKGYTAHFRDPKVWKHEDHWYMVVGAQSADHYGCVVLFESADTKEWVFRGNLSHSTREEFGYLGYMWECPDFFSLDGEEVLIFSPQGVEADGIDYNNLYQTGYVIGELDYRQAEYKHGRFVELDRGFEFYAPQTTCDDRGRRLLVGWLGGPDHNEKSQPTHDYHWIHSMTIPRELRLEKGKLIQKPVEELSELRVKQWYDEQIVKSGVYEIERVSEVHIEGESLEGFELTLFSYMQLIYDQDTELLTLKRPDFAGGNLESRSCRLPQGLKQLQLFIDRSSVEIFINGGEEVFTSRMFADPEEQRLELKTSNSTSMNVQAWSLREDAIHI